MPESRAKRNLFVPGFSFRSKTENRKNRVKNNGRVIARNPVLEQVVCQAEVAKKKEARKAISLLKRAFVRKYPATTVRIPTRADPRNIGKTPIPKSFTIRAWI